MAATIFFGSNTTVDGTNGDDSMVGNASGGNVNDLVYGHQGNDTITVATSLSRSTLFGGQGADLIEVFSGGQNAVYGNLGNDSLFSEDDTGDSIFGGQGDDTIDAVADTAGNIYGNQGNDAIAGLANKLTNLFGGQGNDKISDSGSNLDAIYGNQGNDLLSGDEGISNSHMYGGQGDDTLVFMGSIGTGTFNDAETGGQGNDLFVAESTAGTNSMGIPQQITNVNDIVTVTDFLSGTDKLSESTFASIPLDKIALAGATAASALGAANTFYNTAAHPSEYVFVYGGTGAGYLFYNGDSAAVSGGVAQNQPFAVSGMAILGATGENSVMASDITAGPRFA